MHKHVKHLSLLFMKVSFAIIACFIWAAVIILRFPDYIRFFLFPIALIILYFIFVNSMLNWMDLGEKHYLRSIFIKKAGSKSPRKARPGKKH